MQIGSTSVQIKEFLPDRMKADAKLSQSAPDGWVKPENLKALLTLQNLFGTPAQDRRVEATLTLSPSVPSFRGYADYHFFDPQRAKEIRRRDLSAALFRQRLRGRGRSQRRRRDAPANLFARLPDRREDRRHARFRPARCEAQRQSDRDRSEREKDRSRRPQACGDRTALRFDPDQAGIGRVQVRVEG